MKGIIFDLDGTLWEVTDKTFESVNEIAKKYHLKKITKETVCSVFGLNKLAVARVYFPNMNLKESMNLIDEITTLNIQKLELDGGHLYSNLKDTIKVLAKNFDLYIVSNTSRISYIEAFLNTSGLKKYFKNYIAASELNISKSDAIKKVISDNNLDCAIYVGDTRKDLESALLANIPFIHARYGYDQALSTSYYIDDLSELSSVLKNIL